MKRLSLFILIALGLTIVLAACNTSSSVDCPEGDTCVEVAPDDAVRLGYMLTISGATSFLGEDSRGGIEIAIDDRGGEIAGHSIELVGEDSLCSAEGGQTAAQKMASDTQLVGIVGTNCSSAATSALPIISDAGLVLISPSNTAAALTDPNGTWKPGYFRTAHNDNFQGRIAADFAYNEQGARTAATIHDGSPYADGLQDAFAARFEELGGTITFQGAVNVGDTDMRPILTSIAANSPDLLYFPIFEPEGNFIADQSTEISGLENTVLFGADGLLVDGFAANTGPAAVGMFLSGPVVTGDAYQQLLTKWETKFGGSPPSGFHGHAYDATNILLDAIDKVAITGSDGTVLIPRNALRDAITATASFDGVTGKLTCSDTGDCATGEALGIYEITDAEVSQGNWPPDVTWTP